MNIIFDPRGTRTLHPPEPTTDRILPPDSVELDQDDGDAILVAFQAALTVIAERRHRRVIVNPQLSQEIEALLADTECALCRMEEALSDRAMLVGSAL